MSFFLTAIALYDRPQLTPRSLTVLYAYDIFRSETDFIPQIPILILLIVVVVVVGDHFRKA